MDHRVVPPMYLPSCRSPGGILHLMSEDRDLSSTVLILRSTAGVSAKLQLFIHKTDRSLRQNWCDMTEDWTRTNIHATLFASKRPDNRNHNPNS